jgi:hypothetical protein
MDFAEGEYKLTMRTQTPIYLGGDLGDEIKSAAKQNIRFAESVDAICYLYLHQH